MKSALKSERKEKVYHHCKKYQGPEKIMQGAKQRYYREIQSQQDSIEKANTRKILNKKNNIKREVSGKS